MKRTFFSFENFFPTPVGRFVLGFALLFMFSGVFSATITWIGTGTASYNISSNWDLGRVPVPGDNVVFPDSPSRQVITVPNGDTIDVNTIILGENNTLALGNGGKLIVDGTMEIKANGLLNNSTSCTITIGSNFVNGGNISLVSSSASLSVSGVVTGTGSISGGSGNLEFSGFFQQAEVSLESGPAAFGGECSVSGDFTAGSGRVDFGADCTVGGTLTASSGTTVFEGNLEAGTFVHNNGVTEFSGTEQNVTGSGTGFEFYNTTVFPGSAVTFLKNTEITGALANNGIINLSGTDGLEVYGITSGNGSISGDSGNLVFTGDCTQNSISLNSGTVSFAGNCTLTGNFTAGSGTATFGKDSSVGGFFSASTSVTVFRGNLEAGSFEHNNGRVEFSGTVQNLTDSGTGGNLDFNEVFITAGTDVLAFLDLTVAGNLTNNGNLTFSGSSGMKVDGTTFGSGSITGDSGNLVFTGDCSVGGTLTASTGTTVFKGNLEAQDFVHNGGTAEFSGSQSQNVTGANFTSLYRIYIDKPSSDIEFSGPVNFADLNAAACRNITFSKSVTGTGLSESSDTVKINSSGDISFMDGLSIEKGNFVVTGGNSLVVTGAFNLKAGNADLDLDDGEIFFNQTVEITGNGILTGGKISILNDFNSNNLTVNNSGLFLLKASLAADNFTQNQGDYGTGENQIQGNITSNGTIVFENDVFIGLTGESGGVVFMAGTGETINIKGDLFIARDFTPENPLKAQNILLASGKVTLRTGNSFEAEKDLILLGAGADFDDGASGVTGLFSYFNPGRDGLSIAKPSLSALPSKFPDGTMFPDGTAIPFAGTFADLTGVSLKTGKNFYANGINLAGTGNWNLYLADNGSALSAFAEAYNLTVSNSTVVCSSSGSAWVAAGENCSDGGGNFNWDFTKPEILTDNQALKEGETGSGTYTITDDTIRIEFTESIENRNNEISKAVSNIKFMKNGTPVSFTGTFTDPLCRSSTDGKGNLSVFYIRTSQDGISGERWNTDATGISPGENESTDRGRGSTQPVHRDVVPSITLPAALDSVFQTLRDEHKNRICHYSDMGGADKKGTFTETKDRCPPVIAGVYTGQELHENEMALQKPYDSHNFIEIRYSEAVAIGNLAPDCENIRVSDSFGTATSHGGSIVSEESGGLEITGFCRIEKGLLETGTRENPSDNTVHSLYRNFSRDGTTAVSAQSHRVRISIAGYREVSENKIINGIECNFWPGFIEKAETPSGKVEPFSNQYITESSSGTRGFCIKAYNPDSVPFDYANFPGEDPFPRWDVRVDNSVSGLYGKWDTSKPGFAWFSVNRDGNRWENFENTAEVIPLQNQNGKITGFEVHITDNFCNAATSEYLWRSKRGWFDGSNSQAGGENGKIPESFGGSRPDSLQGKTSGGIRESSLYDCLGYFEFSNGNTAATPEKISTEVTSSFMTGKESYVHNATDDPYFSLGFNSEQWSISDLISVNYRNGFITDLAGNRMDTAPDYECIDRIPPVILLTFAGAGKNQLYILFSKQMSLGSVNGANTVDGIKVKLDDSTYISPVKAEIPEDNPYAILFTFEDNLEFSDITGENSKNGIEFVSCALVKDDITGNDVYVPPICDVMQNFISGTETHRISDFGIGIVQVLYGTDGIHEKGLYGNQETADSGALRNFEYGKSGKLHDKDITIGIRLNLPEEELPEENPVLYYDSGIDGNLRGDLFTEYTKGLKREAWLPSALNAYSSRGNTEARAINPTPGTSGKQLQNFVIPASDYEMEEGNSIEMIFSYKGLFCVNLENQGDISSIVPWEFRIGELVPQRGGVTIFNNVINSRNREQTVLQVTVPKSGNLTVQVFTLDGNLVKTLARTSVNKGTYTYRWDGTNGAGNPVARSLYFVKITGPGIDEIRKVMVVQ